MGKNENDIYAAYKLARDNIQLVNAFITEVALNKKVDIWEVDRINDLSFSRRIEITNNKQASACLKVDIKIKNQNTKEDMAEISIVCKGLFSADSSIDNFEKLLALQVVPQLLPFVRAAVSNLSAMMAIPAITLPTMDIIKTISINHDKPN